MCMKACTVCTLILVSQCHSLLTALYIHWQIFRYNHITALLPIQFDGWIDGKTTTKLLRSKLCYMLVPENWGQRVVFIPDRQDSGEKRFSEKVRLLALKHARAHARTHTHTKVTIIHHIIRALATLFLPACSTRYILFSP